MVLSLVNTRTHKTKACRHTREQSLSLTSLPPSHSPPDPLSPSPPRLHTFRANRPPVRFVRQTPSQNHAETLPGKACPCAKRHTRQRSNHTHQPHQCCCVRQWSIDAHGKTLLRPAVRHRALPNEPRALARGQREGLIIKLADLLLLVLELVFAWLFKWACSDDFVARHNVLLSCPRNVFFAACKSARISDIVRHSMRHSDRAMIDD